MAKASKQVPAREAGRAKASAVPKQRAAGTSPARPAASARPASAGRSARAKNGQPDRATGARRARPAPRTEPTPQGSREPEKRKRKARVGTLVQRAPAPPLQDADRDEAGRGCYVYCIIGANAPLRFGTIGMNEQWPQVYTINFQDVAAVVSDVPIAPLDSTRENVLAHERVNETVMRDHTVIPMSFGTIFKTAGDIVELMRSAYEAFAEVLDKMQDKLEFGLKVLWDRDEIVRAIQQEDEDIHRLKAEIASQKGSTYFARMQYGRLIDSALQHRSEQYVAEFLQRLRDVSVASRVNRAIGDKMIMNAAFLVQRDKEQAFDRRVKEIAANFDTLTFKFTGPWPPYNFVNIRLKLERAES